MLESGVRWIARKLTGSKRGGDYCWSAFTCEQPQTPWYLRGATTPREPAPEDSQELKALPKPPDPPIP